MKYKVIISETAKEQISFHLKFISNVNKAAAKKTGYRIYDSLKSLSDMPARFPFFNEQYIPMNYYHKMYVDNWYVVLYQIKDNIVYVDYVLDCRQDYSWLIK